MGDVTSAQKRFWPDPQPLVERLGRSFFQQLPKGPGVYLMHGVDEMVLYVGKAKSLRHRLGSYRVANPERMPRRTLRLLQLVRRIVWEECSDEPAALRRESELLLSLKPRFNRAGVWAGPKRFLVWRAVREGLALAVTTEPAEGWSVAGPFGGRAVGLHRALVRLLWGRFQPERGLAGMPSGWFGGAHGNQTLIPTQEPGLASDAEKLLNGLFAGSPSTGSGQAPSTGSGQAPSTDSGRAAEPFRQWLVPPVSVFETLCWQEDVLDVCETRPKKGEGTVEEAAVAGGKVSEINSVAGYLLRGSG